MSHERPETLLKSALEKIVYFEARATQLGNDLKQAQSECDRVKTELAAASQREIDLRRVIAELEVRTTRAHAEREQAANLAEALRRERAELLGKILEASRLNADANDFDLASFISELRSEVILRRGGDATGSKPEKLDPSIGGAPLERAANDLAPRSSTVTEQAQFLRAQGRLTVSQDDLAALERAFPFTGRSEETLFGFSVRELGAPDAAARARAAERLKALGHPAAAPALATALHAETEPSVQTALLLALGTVGKAETVAVVVPLLSSPSADVRMTALKVLLKLDSSAAGPYLAASVKDPDASVRRRASLLALGLRGAAALDLGETAIRDENADVRSLAALVLGASGVESARPWLMQAMRDPEIRVRRSASQALSRLLGRDVSQLVELDDAQRRREVRRLSHVAANPVKAKVVASLPAPALAPSLPRSVTEKSTSEKREFAPFAGSAVALVTQSRASGAASMSGSAVAGMAGSGRPVATKRVAVVEAPVTSSAPNREIAPTDETVADALLQGVMTELRSAIRGQPADALATSLNISLESARSVCAVLMEKGQVVRRGHKYFVA